MYKVFIDNKPIYFIQNNEKHHFNDQYQIYSFKNKSDIDQIMKIHSTNNNLLLIVSSDHLENLIDEFFHDYKKVIAAGGVVINSNSEILFIKRLGFWDLPKGKVEKNEAIDIAAIREVEEECGISNPVIVKHLINTYHTYTMKGNKFFKETYWYLMQYDGKEKLIPQKEESISDVKWVTPNNMNEQLANTYPSILDVLSSFTS